MALFILFLLISPVEIPSHAINSLNHFHCSIWNLLNVFQVLLNRIKKEAKAVDGSTSLAFPQHNSLYYVSFFVFFFFFFCFLFEP